MFNFILVSRLRGNDVFLIFDFGRPQESPLHKIRVNPCLNFSMLDVPCWILDVRSFPPSYQISPAGQIAIQVLQQPYEAQANGFLPPLPSRAPIGQFLTQSSHRVQSSFDIGFPAGKGQSVMMLVTKILGPNSGVIMLKLSPIVPIPARYIAGMW